MNRIFPVLVAASFAVSGAAIAQNANTTNPNGNAPLSNLGGAAPGTAPTVGGTAPGIAPNGTPPTVGGTAAGGGMAGPGMAPAGVTPTTPMNNGTAPNRATANNPNRRGNGALDAGANSFTMGQARARIQRNGFTQVSDLHKDNQGIWRGKAMRNGQSVNVSMDYQGNVAAQ